MPEMDGLEALPHVLAAAPGTRVIVLSGFDQQIGDQALVAGAPRFVQQGGGLKEIRRAIESVLPRREPPPAAAGGSRGRDVEAAAKVHPIR